MFAALYSLCIFENVFEARDFTDRVAVVFDYDLATGHPAVITFVGLFQFSSFECKFGAPWCEVFVDKDVVFGRASFVEVFDTAPGMIHSLYGARCRSEQWWFSALSEFQ